MLFAESIQEGWILAKDFFSAPGVMRSLLLLTLGLAGWLTVRASTSIIGEYAKRAWFRYIHREALQRESRASAEAKEAQAALKTEFADYRVEVSMLIEDYERLLTQNAWLWTENARLRKILLQGRKSLPDDDRRKSQVP